MFPGFLWGTCVIGTYFPWIRHSAFLTEFASLPCFRHCTPNTVTANLQWTHSESSKWRFSFWCSRRKPFLMQDISYVCITNQWSTSRSLQWIVSTDWQIIMTPVLTCWVPCPNTPSRYCMASLTASSRRPWLTYRRRSSPQLRACQHDMWWSIDFSPYYVNTSRLIQWYFYFYTFLHILIQVNLSERQKGLFVI